MAYQHVNQVKKNFFVIYIINK